MDRPEDLPTVLAERTRSLTEATPKRRGEFVLYWMRTAVRGHENPALDVAMQVANHRGLPVFVYHALSERYPYASDRHHTFILEGARDVQAELAARGIGYAFHLERPRLRGAFLRDLAARAALVVTEEMPVSPLREWTAALAGTDRAPVWSVDTACLVPMRQVGRAYERAFAFREATRTLRARALATEWVDVDPELPPISPDLPFAAVDLANANIPALIEECAIDHTVGPVADTRGGSRAGYARWQSFRDGSLARYARLRNDPLRDGVSRMSAYLHYGQVSPFRLAREAHASGGPGAEKYLDELLVWRELAYAYCFYREDHERWETLPAWARASLEQHTEDPREAVLSWETLARSRTEDALWDAAQASLRIHGELHNNVRMTWGKALLRWTRIPQRALHLAIDLNHRYALDGRDPASFGGILWCFGAFDRPFSPEQPVFGTVRTRATREHARRLDVDRFAARVARPPTPHPPRIAVIGGGISGLACARTLHDHGIPVTVFDKARRPGGRMSTRRGDGVAFDHGAQYFTARDSRTAPWIASWQRDGLIAPWNARFASLTDGVATPESQPPQRFVGVPGMSAITGHLARDLDVITTTRVVEVDGRDLVAESMTGDGTAKRERFGSFDAIVVATPAPQAVALLARAPGLAQRASTVALAPCQAVLVEFARPVDLDFDAARVHGSPLAWVARNDSKPGRPPKPCWVLHGSAAWSAEHRDTPAAEVADALLAAFFDACRIEPVTAVSTRAHRWLFAQPLGSLDEPCLFDPSTATGACGDWCVGGRVEGALLSGAALAGRLLAWTVARPGVRPPRQAGLFEAGS